jgi:hypothetical protein
MRLRGFVAVGAGVAGATLAHALDQAGLLPGVREAANVRSGMSGSVTVLWLGLAAMLSWLAGRFGPVRVGAPASLLIAAIPELVGRHDLGAVVEPGAIAGAMLQWLLLLVVVAAVVVASRSALTVLVPSYGAISWPASVGPRPRARTYVVDRRGRPRAPPKLPLPVHVV